MKFTRTLILNKKNHQYSITLPKKQLKRYFKGKKPKKVKFSLEGIW
jgi:hypothetical protein